MEETIAIAMSNKGTREKVKKYINPPRRNRNIYTHEYNKACRAGEKSCLCCGQSETLKRNTIAYSRVTPFDHNQ